MIEANEFVYENNDVVFIEGLFYNQITSLTKKTR